MSGRVWYAVDVVVTPAAVEAVESAFNELGSIGTEVAWLRKRADEPRRVTGFFDAAVELSDVRAAVDSMLTAYGAAAGSLESIESRTLEEQDWLVEWKKHWQPTYVGRFIITPPWIDVGATDKIVIQIEP